LLHSQQQQEPLQFPREKALVVYQKRLEQLESSNNADRRRSSIPPMLHSQRSLPPKPLQEASPELRSFDQDPFHIQLRV